MTTPRDPDDPLDRLARERLRPGLRAEFHAQLDQLERQLIVLANEPARAVDEVTRAFLAGDREVATAWVDRHAELAEACGVLEEDCYVFLARQGPVAGDLRRVVTTLRGANDVLRTSSLLGHVARTLDFVDPHRLPPSIRERLRELGTVVAEVFSAAVQSWRDADGLAAVDLMASDDRADRLHQQLLADVFGSDCSLEEAVSLALLARYYERIADHGVELARGVTWAVTGDRVTGG